MNITLVAGARPNFMKIAPILDAIAERQLLFGIHYRLVHTGQHFDKKMSGDFFTQLGIPYPDVNLNAGGGTQAEQTGRIMVGFEQELSNHHTDLVLVVGDVTSTLACTIVAKKMNIRVAHVEAGIRSGDKSMPEEINRIVTDSITDYFFTTSVTASKNLLQSGASEDSIFFVGNTMIDTLYKQMPNFKQPEIWEKANLKPSQYFVLTLHRPSNVDEVQDLETLINTIITQVRGFPVIFPVHPRTAIKLGEMAFSSANLFLTEPLSYLEFNYLVKYARAVITDSGGITEETTVMGIPCMTLRNSTERPETCNTGTNELLGTNPDALKPALEKLFNGFWSKGAIPELWDGKTGVRIVDHLIRILSEGTIEQHKLNGQTLMQQ